MKHTLRNALMIAALLGLFTLIAYAATAPETVKFETKMGVITFSHKTHQSMEGVSCKTCHHTSEGAAVDKKCSDCHTDKAEGKRLSMKDAAHKLCKDCHKAKKKGPQAKCTDCHVKAPK
jgi:hypothetical protein